MNARFTIRLFLLLLVLGVTCWNLPIPQPQDSFQISSQSWNELTFDEAVNLYARTHTES